jgi:transposase
MPAHAPVSKKKRPAEFAHAKVVLEQFTIAARRGDVRVMYCDESGFAATPNVQRAWAPIRHPHAATPVSHAKRVSVIGALDIVSGNLTFDTVKSVVSRQRVVDFFDQLARSNDGRPLILILDNAKIHHHIDPDMTYRWLVGHNMLLWYLPPYSPELNPIEIVWKHAKYFWRRFSTWTAETLESEVTALMDGFGSKFQINFA